MKKQQRLSLCVFIDAFGWELARKHAFLDGILALKAPLQTIFGYSSTCDPTIITGLLPRDHGHFAFFRYAPSRSPFRWYRPLSYLPKSLMNRGRVRHKLSQWFKKLHGYTGYFQLYNMPFDRLHLFDYSEKRDLYEKDGINSGAPTLFDELRARGIPYFMSDWRQGEEANLRDFKAALGQRPFGFAYVYLAAMDAVLHAHGTHAPQVAEKIQWYDRQLRDLIAAAETHYETVRLFVFSDHGMTDIHDLCDLIALVEPAGLRFGEDYAAVYDSTMARFWFLKPGARETIESVLVTEPRGRCMTREELAAWGCDFEGDTYGELFFLMNPGVLICPSFMGEKPLAGMHGYSPEDAGSVAAFMSSVPVSPLPNRLDDLYRLMMREALEGENRLE
ncbi:MAG: alkaline phosphatase family protein [Candidatus Hydrogenedentes bacterium]|nr:alkaline phosphatase family protein [Candidatus Hydrogenedentota bacterium]